MLSFVMAWSPVRRSNAGIRWVETPGDYATLNSNHSRDATSSTIRIPVIGRKKWEILMNKFVVVTFAEEAKIPHGTSALKKMHVEGGVKLHASAIVVRDPSGKLSVQEVTKEGLGGTAVGALIGGLAGLPLGPLSMTMGLPAAP
jgi:hypothetical protein